MTSLGDTPLAELLLARGLVGRPILAEALDHVRADRDQDPHLRLGVFLLQRGVLPAHVIESALRHLAGQEGAPLQAGPQGWGHVSTLEDAPAAVESSQAERLGPYRLLRKLAEGGMGAVFEVEHESMGGRFALKTIKREACELLGEDSLVRLQREARLTAAVDHPQVVKIHAADFESETPYLVQDLLVKGSLQGRIERSGRLSPAQAVELVASLAEGLAAAHAHEILHRDLKPDNVLFNERDEPVIVDFGLARRVGQNSVSLTQAGEILGTPSYMAPEQAVDATEASAASDVYALGAILYFVLEGRPPFVGETVLETLSLVLTEPPPLAEHAPPALAQAITELLAKEPSERPTALEVPALLRGALAPGAGGRPASTNLWLGALAGVLLLGLGVGLWSRSSSQPKPTPELSHAASPLATPSPPAELEGVVAELAGETPHLRALAAIDLLRLAPNHERANAARRELRRLTREPMLELPPLRGHRNVAWLRGDRVAAATPTELFTLDLRREELEWIQQEAPADRLLSRIEARGGQAWLTLAKPTALLDLAPGANGQTIEADPTWPLRPVGLTSVALSPSGRWALSGGAGDLVLWDLEARSSAAYLHLPYDERRIDVQVERMVFFDEEHALGILNLRHPPAPGKRLAPAEGHLFLVRRVGSELKLVGIQGVGLAGHALAVGGGDVYASGDGGGFWRYRVESFNEGWVERFGEIEAGVRRVVGVAWISPGHLVTGRDVSSPTVRLTELGHWRQEGQDWSYTRIGDGDRLREIFYAPRRELLLLSARQSSASRGPAGSVWFLGDVDK